MGSAESTSRTNGNNQEEEERKQKYSTAVGAAATIAAVGVAAWGISRMLSDNTDTQENESAMKMKMQTEPSYVLEGSSRGIITWRPPPEGRLKLNTDATCHPNEDNNNTYVDWDGDSVKFQGSSQGSITWCPPPEGRLKLNTDGTCHPDEDNNNTYVDGDGDSVKRGPAGYEGILRDHNGEWVRGFIGYIGETDSQTAELYGIHKGLLLLDKHGLTGAILETDCQAAHQWVTRRDDYRGKKKSTHDSWNIIKKCRELADKNDITISLFNRQHAKKRVNKCADKLADIAIETRVNYKELMDLPNVIRDLVSEDAKFY